MEMDVAGATGEGLLLSEGPGQEAVPAMERPQEPDMVQLQEQVTQLQAQVKALQSELEMRSSEAAAELARQREMFKGAMAQSDKLAQEELDKRITEHTHRETALTGALHELQQALESGEQQGETVVVKLPKIDWARLIPLTNPPLTYRPPPPIYSPTPATNPRKRGRGNGPSAPPIPRPAHLQGDPPQALGPSARSLHMMPQHHILVSSDGHPIGHHFGHTVGVHGSSQMLAAPMLPTQMRSPQKSARLPQAPLQNAHYGGALMVAQPMEEEATGEGGEEEEEEARDPHKDSKKCRQAGCDKYASYSLDNEHDRTRMYCKAHKKPGMVNRKNKRCQHVGCTKGPVMSFPGDKKASRCKAHMLKGMVDVINKRCKFEGGCSTQPSYGFAGERPSRCKEHMLPGMGNTRSRLCSEPECQIRPLFGFWGETTPSRCKTHCLPGQTNILHLQCSHPTCHQKPVVFGLPDDAKPRRCAEHALQGMVDFRQKLVTLAAPQPAEAPDVTVALPPPSS